MYYTRRASVPRAFAVGARPERALHGERDAEQQSHQVEQHQHEHPRAERLHARLEERMLRGGLVEQVEDLADGCTARAHEGRAPRLGSAGLCASVRASASRAPARAHGEGDDEVDAIEGGANGVRHEPVFERVVRVRRDGESLHERGEVGERYDGCGGEDCARGARPPRGLDLAQHEVREGVVRRKVEMRCKRERERHVVQPPGGHRVPRLEDRVKIVRVPVIADVREDEDPRVRLERVALREGLRGLARAKRRKEGLQEQRRRQPAAHEHVPILVEPLVHLKRDDRGEAADPEDRVLERPDLVKVLGLVALGLGQPIARD
mmetsp:Transcript_1363/g.4457  ORF Transcript_1363/g.4457 Transcript_1363/m.4457 type:complete len:321 (-) Transcript_1363:76-1038(-)